MKTKRITKEHFERITPYIISFLTDSETGEQVEVLVDNNGFLADTDKLMQFKKIIEFTLENIPQEEIQRINDANYKRIFEKQYTCEKKEKIKTKEGFVYILKKTDENIFKIGMSRQFNERKKQISTKLHFEVETFKLFKTNDMEGLEKHFHEKFSKKRLNGEWFKLDLKDTNYIENFSITYNGVI